MTSSINSYALRQKKVLNFSEISQNQIVVVVQVVLSYVYLNNDADPWHLQLKIVTFRLKIIEILWAVIFEVHERLKNELWIRKRFRK